MWKTWESKGTRDRSLKSQRIDDKSRKGQGNVLVDLQYLDQTAVNVLLITLLFQIVINRLFWSTVCKTVRPMLSDHCPVCLSVCLSVTFVHCGQTVGRTKMKLGVQVGLGPGHIV